MIITDSTGALIALGGIAPASGGLATVTMRPSITYDGVTLTFSEPVPTCELAGRRPAILTHLGDVVITNDTPTAETVEGYFANGAMWNPYIELCYWTGKDATIPGTQPQAFDESPDNPANPRRKAQTFDLSACVSPSYSGNGNLTVGQGETGTFVKSVRRDGEAGDYYRSIEKYVPFTFLNAVPVANAVRPSMSGTTKTCDVTPADFDYSVFQSVAKPASMRDLPTALARIPVTFPMFGIGGEGLRLFAGYDTAITNDGYSGYYAKANAEVWNSLHTNISDAAKADALLILIEWARDLMGLYERGWRGGYGAGQWHGIHEVMFLGAFVLQDSAMLAAAQDVMSNLYAAEWIKAADKNLPVKGPDHPNYDGINNPPYDRPFFEDDVGIPNYVGDGFGGNMSRRYFATAGPAMFSGTLFLMGLKNGPGGITGAEAIAQSSDLTTANQLAAPVAYVDRYRTLRPWDFVNDLDTWMLDFYEAVRGSITESVFTCRPDAYEWGDLFTAGAGSISWDLTGIDYNGNLARTDTWIRYGIDGVSFVETNGNSATGSITGLNRGSEHRCQVAFENSAGRGIYSPNYPLEYYTETGLNSGERNVVTPTGTEANAAPSWAGRLAPALFYQPVETGHSPYYEAVDTAETLPSDVTILTAGVGYPSGYPAPTSDDFTYQWKRGVSDISGATSKEYSLTPDDLGQDIKCSVTVTTTEGTASIDTAAVTVYSYPTLAAGVLIDTDCTASMNVIWPGIMDGALSFASDVGPASPLDGITHLPGEYLADQVATADLGVIWCKKTGGRQTYSFPIGPTSGGAVGDVVSGTEYRVTINVLRSCNVSERPASNDPTWLAPVEFCVGSAQARNSQNFVANQNIATDSGTPGRVTLTGTFTPGSTGPAYVNLTTTYGTGGIGGDPVIDGILFEEV